MVQYQTQFSGGLSLVLLQPKVILKIDMLTNSVTKNGGGLSPSLKS